MTSAGQRESLPLTLGVRRVWAFPPVSFTEEGKDIGQVFEVLPCSLKREIPVGDYVLGPHVSVPVFFLFETCSKIHITSDLPNLPLLSREFSGTKYVHIVA